MRSLTLAAAAVLAAATACSSQHSHPAATPAPPEAPKGSATGNPPPPKPVSEGDVRNDDSTFHLKVASVATKHSYTDGVAQPEVAKPGTVLVVVKLAEKNTGKAPSNIEFNTPNPVMLVGADGSTYQRGVDWANSDDINPGLSRTDVYTFDVPASVNPAAVQVTLIGNSSGASQVDLALPK